MDETKLAPGDAVELAIGSLAAGGDGVGRLPDGRAVFVPFTAPGDRVRARLRELRGRFARAEPLELLAPGPGRAEPRCAVFGDCGGCQWQHLDYPAQCHAKRRIVADALQRIGHLTVPADLALVPSPEPWGYRVRARVAVAEGAVGYRRRRSHVICPTRRCPILAPALEARLAELADSRAPREGDWELSPAGARHARASGAPQEIAVGGDRLRISAGVFVQANAGLHEALWSAALEASGSGDLALELYSGAGFFSLGLARAFRRLVAVESHPAAVSDLRHNLERAGAREVEARAERVEALLARGLGDERPDAVLLDPPRGGLPPGGPEALAALGPQRLVYVSCDPATLARDLARLVEGGFALEAVTAFDLFPQTPHVEVLARLSRATLG